MLGMVNPHQAESLLPIHIQVDIPFCLTEDMTERVLTPSEPRSLVTHTPEEECGMGPACWLWDYLRRCAMTIALSGIR